jgi:hypothetical protein
MTNLIRLSQQDAIWTTGHGKLLTGRDEISACHRLVRTSFPADR